MLPRLSLRPRAAPALAAHGPGRPRGRPPATVRGRAALAALVPEVDDDTHLDGPMATPSRAPDNGAVGGFWQPRERTAHLTPRQKMPRGGGARANEDVRAGETSSAAQGTAPSPPSHQRATGGGSGGPTTSATPPRLAPGKRAAPENVVHALLPFASHTSARAVLGWVERRRGLSPAGAAALDGWAAREADERTRRRIRLACRAERVPFAPAPSRAQWVPGTRANKALWYRFPPLASLPAHPSPADFLGHQHHLLIATNELHDTDAADPDVAALVDVDVAYSLPTALTTVAALGGTPADRLAALHLALAYAEAEDVTRLLDTFEEWHGATTPSPVSPVRRPQQASPTAPAPPQLSRQTLHLSLLATLRARTTIDDVRALCARFKRTPGPETWRHVAQHALAHSDARLAKLAFTRAKAELAAERATAMPKQSAHVNPFGAGGGTTPRAARAAAGKLAPVVAVAADKASSALGIEAFADHARQPDTSVAGIPGAASPPAPRFAHLGRHTQRWEWTMHALAARGWVARGPPVAQVGFVPRLIERWRWIADVDDADHATGEAAADATVSTAEDKPADVYANVNVPFVRAPRHRRRTLPSEQETPAAWWPWRARHDHAGDHAREDVSPASHPATLDDNAAAASLPPAPAPTTAANLGRGSNTPNESA